MADVRTGSWTVQSALVLLVVMSAALTGCGDGHETIIGSVFTTLTVEVSGTEGKRFRGDYDVGFGSTPLNGTVPATEEVSTAGETVRATIRKVDPGLWTLTVCVQIKRRKVISPRTCNTTIAEFGQVTATTSLP